MGSEDTFLFKVEDGVGVVTLNRPDRLNAITWDMASGLVELFRREAAELLHGGSLSVHDDVAVLQPRTH